MRQSIVLAGALAAFASTATLANITIGQPVDTEDAEIIATLEAAGYTDAKIGRGYDEIEIDADRERKSHEIDPSITGDVIGIELGG